MQLNNNEDICCTPYGGLDEELSVRLRFLNASFQLKVRNVLEPLKGVTFLRNCIPGADFVGI